jgi:protein-S-isoprenylcysteine O-methyltransferase Ste14
MGQRRRLVPPVYFLLTLIAMALLDRLLPIVHLVPVPYSYVGWVPLAAGMWLTGSAYRGFVRAGTPIVPFERSTALVTSGSYRITRNPMYLGLVLILSGIAILFGTLSAWLPIPLFIWILYSNFISREERFLEELFGQQYLTYKSRVRRWL